MANESSQRHRLLRLANAKFKAAASSSTHNTATLVAWASSLYQEALVDAKNAPALLKFAYSKLQDCHNIDASLPGMHFKWGTICLALGVLERDWRERQAWFQRARSNLFRSS